MGGGGSKQKLIICLIILLILAGGITYAAFKFNFLGEANTLKTDSIELKLLESNTDIIDLKNIFPMPDEQGIKQTDTFDFAVITNTSSNVNMEYNIKIEKLSADTGYNTLNDNQIKVYLTDYNNKVLVSPTKISDLSNYTLYTKTNKHSSTNKKITNKYKLKVWIDNSVNASNWDENTKLEYKFKIGVNGEATKPTPTATDTLITKVGESGLEVVTHEANSTLQIGATEDLTEYRYRGGNDVVTNNYVYFNCDDINNQTKDTCELYRIIGIFPTDDGAGNIENRIKLIKVESYGNNYWDYDYLTDISSNQEDITTNKMIITEEDDYIVRKVVPDYPKGQNNWAEATLNKILNKTYYNSINENYQNLIGDAKYYLGGYKSTDITTDEIYKYERKISGSAYYASGNPTSWTGKIALMYASDYGYVYSDSTKELSDMGYVDDVWFRFSSITWLLNQNCDQHLVFIINSKDISLTYPSGLATNDTYNSAFPVFYLASNASFNNIGDGSSTNPYQLKG